MVEVPKMEVVEVSNEELDAMTHGEWMSIVESRL